MQALSYFDAMDTETSSAVTISNFMEFWRIVLESGQPEATIAQELDRLEQIAMEFVKEGGERVSLKHFQRKLVTDKRSDKARKIEE